MAGNDQGIAALVMRAAWLRGMALGLLVVDAVAALITVTSLYFQMISPFGFTDALRSNGFLMAILLGGTALASVAFLLLTLAISVLLMLWIHRAWSNLRGAGLQDLHYSPAWAVGSFFVPFINLVVPMRAMRELANRSAGEDAWQAALPVADINSWWSCLIAGIFIRSIVLLVAMVDSIPYLHVTTPPAATIGLSLLSVVLLMASTWFLYRVVGTITGDQRAMLHVSGTFD